MTRQPDSLPTNKAIAMAFCTVAFHQMGKVVSLEIMEAYGLLISVGLAFIPAWFVPDRAQK